MARQHLHLLLYPVVQRLHQRQGFGFSDRQPFIRWAAADLRFDGVQLTDTLQRFGCDIGGDTGVDIVDFSAGVCHTRRFGDAPILVKRIVTDLLPENSARLN